MEPFAVQYGRIQKLVEGNQRSIRLMEQSLRDFLGQMKLIDGKFSAFHELKDAFKVLKDEQKRLEDKFNKERIS